jgi:hypothetical protein
MEMAGFANRVPFFTAKAQFFLKNRYPSRLTTINDNHRPASVDRPLPVFNSKVR